MGAVTQPVDAKLPRVTTEHTVREWLDALATGGCDQDAFLHAMRERFESDPDGNWEVLSLLDQYYRRGKIRADVFLAIKTSLSGSAMGALESADLSPRQRPEAAVTAPPPPTAEDSAAAQTPEAGREFRPGDVLRSRYRIQGLVGQGGMGTVYEAIDDYRLDVPPNGQTIALKILHTAVTKRSELLTELRREFQYLQMLSHPNIVRVHEFERDGAVAFFTMEMLHGMLLSRIFTARHGTPLDRAQALAVLRATGAAIAHAHGEGVVHGDINPQNIFITNDGEVRVLDFGTSHRFFGGPVILESHLAGLPFATPGYASCQVLEGGRPDASDDIFALGCVAYLLFTGKHPFRQRTAIEARESRIRPKRPRGLTGRQWHALKSALRFKRDKRPSNVAVWLSKMGLTAAAPRLAPINDLIDIQTVSYRKYIPIVAYSVLGLLILGTAAWTASNWTLVSRSAADWGGSANASLSSAGTGVQKWIQKLRPGSDPTDFHNFSIKPPTDSNEAPSGAAEATPTPTKPAPVQNAPAAAASPAASASAPPAPVAHSEARTPQTIATPPPQNGAPTAPAPKPAAAPNPASQGTQVPASSTAAAAPANTIPAGATAAAPPAHPGSVRIEMAADTLDVAPRDTFAHVTVHRRGNLHAETSFFWWTESGTAKPGTDFAQIATHVDHFEDGKNSAVLNIPLVTTLRAQPKSFYVVIDQTEEGGASVGQRTVTMVTLPPSE